MKKGNGEKSTPTTSQDQTPDMLSTFYMDIAAISILFTLFVLVVCLIRELISRRREYLRQRRQLQQGVELQPLRPAAAAGETKMRPLSDEPGDVKFDKSDRRKIVSDLDERYEPLRGEKSSRNAGSELNNRFVSQRPSLNRFLSQKND